MNINKYFKKTGFFLVVVLIVSYCILPYIWQIITSVTKPSELTNFNKILPSEITFDNYINLLFGRGFGRYILNSVVVAGLTTMFCVFIGSLSSYALANIKVRGKKVFFALILTISMFPQIAIVSSLFVIIKNAGLLNTYTGLVLSYITLNLPLTIWILTSFFKEIPYSLVEAAKVDGASPFVTFYKVIAPLAAPGVFTASILIFINAWNEFLFALTFTSDITRQTIPVGITMLPSIHFVPWADMAAASIIVTVPLIVLVFFFQGKIIKGLTSGAVKE